MNMSQQQMMTHQYCSSTFQERIAPKSIEIDIEKLHTKFSALNVDFDGLRFNFLGSRKPVHKRIKERYPGKRHYFTVVGQFLVKTVADRHGHTAITTSTNIELFSRINIDDFE